MTPEQALQSYLLPIVGTGALLDHAEFCVDLRHGMRPLDLWAQEVSWPLDGETTAEEVRKAIEATVHLLIRDVCDAAQAVDILPENVQTTRLRFTPVRAIPGRRTESGNCTNRAGAYLYARVERTTARLA